MPYKDPIKAAEWRRQHRKLHPDRYRSRDQKSARKLAAVRKTQRRDPSYTYKFVVQDSRKTDNRLNRENDLTYEWVKAELSRGCDYCGATDLRMTLDRKDNSKRHTQNNVVPACIRCNLLRRDMPYPAWLCLVDGLRRARENGLFGEWTGSIHLNQSNRQS